MPRQVETFGSVKAGKLSILERDLFVDALRTLKDGQVSVTVKLIGKQRSNPQNRYYRGLVVPMIAQAMSDAYGEEIDEDETHEFLKVQFNLRTIDTENGSLQLAGSTTRLDTAEFMAYVEKCRNWAAELFNINIPDPVKIETADKPLPV